MRLKIAYISLAFAGATSATPLPEYELQDAFIYDDGRVEQLVSMDGNTLTWSTFAGRRYQRDRNFTIPLLQWDTVESKGTRRASPEARSLWPLKPGKNVRFRVVTTASAQGKDGSIQRGRRTELWSCRVLPPAPITVPAGTFDSVEIRCEKFSPRTMRILSEERWYYSEEVGHYISRSWVELSTGRRSGYALVAALRGREANPGRIRSILSGIKTTAGVHGCGALQIACVHGTSWAVQFDARAGSRALIPV